MSFPLNYPPPFFTIITPTINRASLHRCIESVSEQSFPYWEHHVIFDMPQSNSDPSFFLNQQWLMPRRIFHSCKERHNNFGNTCRRNVWNDATGRYLIYLDDDNYLHDTDALLRIARNLEDVNFPDWAVFPILKSGEVYYDGDPRRDHVDTANLVIKREHGRWPNIPDYAADATLVEFLRSTQLRYKSFPLAAPIIVYPKQNQGAL